MLSVVFIMLLVLALAPQLTRAAGQASHVAVVAVARAEIIAGVRISSERLLSSDDTGPQPHRSSPRLPRPRERPCPEEDKHPCRMIVFDMP